MIWHGGPSQGLAKYSSHAMRWQLPLRGSLPLWPVARCSLRLKYHQSRAVLQPVGKLGNSNCQRISHIQRSGRGNGLRAKHRSSTIVPLMRCC